MTDADQSSINRDIKGRLGSTGADQDMRSRPCEIQDPPKNDLAETSDRQDEAVDVILSAIQAIKKNTELPPTVLPAIKSNCTVGPLLSDFLGPRQKQGPKDSIASCPKCGITIQRSMREYTRHRTTQCPTSLDAEEIMNIREYCVRKRVEVCPGVAEILGMRSPGKGKPMESKPTKSAKPVGNATAKSRTSKSNAVAKIGEAYSSSTNPVSIDHALSMLNAINLKDYMKLSKRKSHMLCLICGCEMKQKRRSLVSHKANNCKNIPAAEYEMFRRLHLSLKEQTRAASSSLKSSISEQEPIPPSSLKRPSEQSLPKDITVELDSLPPAIQDAHALDLVKSETHEVCQVCSGRSAPYDHMAWNNRWLGCITCGEAMHRACVEAKGMKIFAVEPLSQPCSPYSLVASNWHCPSCRSCEKCKEAKDVSECIQCHRQLCSSCTGTTKQRPLWTGLYHVCGKCGPKCLSCGDKLGEARAAESRWCPSCQVDLVHARACPVCIKTYPADDCEEDDDSGDNGSSAAADEPMIQCDGCDRWVHFPCTGLELKELQRLQRSSNSKYQCPVCAPKDVSSVQAPLSEPSPLVYRRGAIGVGRDLVQLRLWDYGAKNQRSRRVWTLEKKANGQFCVKSQDMVFSGPSAETALDSLAVYFRCIGLDESSTKRIISKFTSAMEQWSLFTPPPSSKPAVKRKKKTKKQSLEEATKKPEAFVLPADDGQCARVRLYSKPVPTISSNSWSSSSEEENLVDTFNARFVPVWTERTREYRTVTISIAYRDLGNPLQRGAVLVQRSPIAGYGLFAGRSYRPNELIIEYQGEVIGQALADWREARHPRYRHSCYMFRLDDTRIIDATIIGNAARFINHSCLPNCRTKTLTVDGQLRIFIVAKKEIRTGEEFSYDYQFALDEEDGKGRLPCYCGARKCRGWMN